MLDPIADKVLVSATLLMLAADETIAGLNLIAAIIILRLEDPRRACANSSPELQAGWTARKNRSKFDWEKAKPAARDAWDRVNDAGVARLAGNSGKHGLA